MLDQFFLFFHKENKNYKIKFNWGLLISFVYFWTYGYYGALTKFENLFLNVVVSIVIVVFFAILLYYTFNPKAQLVDTLILSKSDIKFFLFFLFIFFSVSFSSLILFINGDHFYHSQFSIYHSIFILKIVTKKVEKINLLEAKQVLHIINMILLIAFSLFIYLFSKITSNFFKILLTVILFLFFRIVIMYFGGSADVHPPFRLFPLWISSCVFGINNFSFRFPQLFVLVFLVFLTFKFSSVYLNEKKAFLFAITVGTIPVLLHTSTIVEQSIWGAFLITYLIFILYKKINNAEYEINYIRLVSITSIGVLIRQSIIASMVVIFLLLLLEFKEGKKNLKDFPALFSIFLLCTPFLFSNILINNPAISGIENLDKNIDKSGIIYSLTSGISFISALNNLTYLLLFLPSAFVIYKKINFYYFIFIFFAIILYIEFYSIRPIFWGVGRYQSEFILPFIIVGMLNMSIILNIKNTWIYITLIYLNLIIFYNYYKLNKSPDITKYTFYDDLKKPFEHLIHSESVYPYDKALSAVKKSGYSKNFYLHGTTYGYMPEVLSGFNVEEVVNYNQLNRKNISSSDSLIYSLQKNLDIKLILFSDLKDSILFNGLMNNGWEKWKEFKDYKYSSTIKSLIRK